MPNFKKEIEKCKHPNSRKTIALTKQIKKQDNRKKTKTGQYVKQNLIAEKVAWFRDKIPPGATICSADQIQNMILEYLGRFDEELEQINIKHSIGSRKNRQHANREDIINMTKKRELEEFNTCGTEIPDMMNPKNVKFLLQWNGELRFLQNLKMRRYSKKSLEQQILKNANTNTTDNKSAEEKKTERAKSSHTETSKDMEID